MAISELKKYQPPELEELLEYSSFFEAASSKVSPGICQCPCWCPCGSGTLKYKIDKKLQNSGEEE